MELPLGSQVITDTKLVSIFGRKITQGTLRRSLHSERRPLGGGEQHPRPPWAHWLPGRSLKGPCPLAAPRVTSLSCQPLAGGPWPSGAPGKSIESRIQRIFPEALFPPTRCSHAFLQQISVLATGKGGNGLFLSGNRRDKRQLSSASGKAPRALGSGHLLPRGPRSPWGSAALGDFLRSFREWGCCSSQQTYFLASLRTPSSSSLFRAPITRKTRVLQTPPHRLILSKRWYSDLVLSPPAPATE